VDFRGKIQGDSGEGFEYDIQGRRDDGVTPLGRVLVALGRCRGGMAEARHDLFGGRAGLGSERPGRMPQIVQVHIG